MNSDGYTRRYTSALYLEILAKLEIGTFWVVPARNSLRCRPGPWARDAEAEGTKHQVSCQKSGSLRTQVSQFHSKFGCQPGTMCHS